MVAFETNAKRETFQISRGHACWRGDVDAYRNADYDQALDNQIEDFSHRCYIRGYSLGLLFLQFAVFR